MYQRMEADPLLDQLLLNFELLIASPGVSNVLKIDRDFESFKGFNVIVTTDLFRKKSRFEGTLLRRDELTVVLSQKGRVLAIPRGVVREVRLPDALYEENDIEIMKLQ
ncbi:hypothetical protein B484DRAFT_453204 [Ochromonadaceae sp. CCMP2298]|nr:hypothetical protein B484DRAFT_453204 [Ochromonadaceae sp. CCMP2298]